MDVVTADEATEKLLANVDRPVEIRDAAGRTLGLFTPGRTAEDELYERAAKLFDPVEIERRKRADAGKPTYTFDQVMTHLRSLEGGAGGR